MAITVEAIYENGVLKPVQPLPLAERQRVHLTVEPHSSWAERTAGLLKWKGDHETLQRVLEEAEELEDFP